MLKVSFCDRPVSGVRRRVSYSVYKFKYIIFAIKGNNSIEVRFGPLSNLVKILWTFTFCVSMVTIAQEMWLLEC